MQFSTYGALKYRNIIDFHKLILVLLSTGNRGESTSGISIRNVLERKFNTRRFFYRPGIGPRRSSHDFGKNIKNLGDNPFNNHNLISKLTCLCQILRGYGRSE